MERAFDSGALDCWFSSIYMKKSRPAVRISILCEPDEREKFLKLLFSETTTLGVRASKIERLSLPREIIAVETEYGAIDVKLAKFDGKVLKASPEYEQCREIALKFGIPLREIEAAAIKAFNERQKL
jgi:hypothetical protein